MSIRVHQIEKFQKTVSDFSSLVIVEGKKDKEVLHRIGFLEVMDISGKPLEETLELVSSKKPDSVAILTDFDREGERQLNVLVKGLQSEKIKIDNSIRRQIKLVFSVQRIEELSSFADMIEENTISSLNKMFNRKKFTGRTMQTRSRG